MVKPETKTPSKKEFYFPKAANGEALAKVSKRKATSVAADSAGEAQMNANKAPGRTKNDIVAPSTALGKKSKLIKKEKVIRDSFTMPKSDYDKITALKLKCADSGVVIKKSELLRAGLLILATATDEQLIAAVSDVEAVKTGRPGKN